MSNLEGDAHALVSRVAVRLPEIRSSNRPEWRVEEYEMWLRHFDDLKDVTVQQRLRHLRFMASHPTHPVSLHGSKRRAMETFTAYFTHRKTKQGKAPTALVNDLKTIRKLGEFLGIPKSAWPKLRGRRNDRDRRIPGPEEVYDLLHFKYADHRKYEGQLVKYILIVLFAIGVRPKEVWMLRASDVDTERGEIVIIEPKKGDRRRRLYVEPSWLCTARTRPSLKNWKDVWREKIDAKTDALFLKPDGHPFPSSAALWQWIRRRVIPDFAWFTPYLGRHWSVNARLIEWGFDAYRVAQWHGHESVDTMKNNYDHEARMLARQHGKNWLHRAFYRTRT